MAVALVVDDDPFACEVMGRVCADMGMEVRTAANGVEALEELYLGGVHVVLLDLTMPKLDGFAVLRELRAKPLVPKPAVIVVTATADPAGRVRGTELGAMDFVQKPFRTHELRRRVQRAVTLVELETKLEADEGALVAMRGLDPVTGMGNFGQLYEVLEAELKCAQIGRRPLTCIVLSDETYDSALAAGGRAAGDERLQRWSQQIASRLRATDHVFRVDAAEFVVLLPATPAQGAKRVVEKILATMAGDDASQEKIAAALACYPHPQISQASELFRAANVALAQARGRNAKEVVCFDGF